MRPNLARAQLQPLRAVDLFSGAGGLTHGLHNAKYDVPFALDKDEDACRTLRHNHPKTHVECRSVTTITADEIAAMCGGPIDVIVGGPSCQTFSTAGRKNGWVRKGDTRNDLWRQMLEVVGTLRPKAFLLENVPGLVYWRKGQMGADILEEFDRLGYRVSMEILLAADYGVPQRRRRLFIVGVLGDDDFAFPAKTHLGGWRRDTLDLWERRREEQGLLRHIRTWEAIGDLPPAVTPGEIASRVEEIHLSPFARRMNARGALTGHEVLPIAPEHLKLIEHVPAGGTWRDIPRHLLPDRYRGMRRTDSTNLLGRLAPDLPAYTITTQFNNVTTGCYTHPYADRALTIREAARLQTFPDTYEFLGPVASQCRQVGNAVPPLLAHVLVAGIAQHILGDAAAAIHPLPKPIRPAKALPAPPPTDAATRKRMRTQKNVDTKPERLLRKELHARGLRFQIEKAPVPHLRRRADVVFSKARVAVFVHGCFWHGCPEHARPTKSNTRWWAEKIATNKARDEETAHILVEEGWLHIEVWEHESPADAALRVESIVRSRSPEPSLRAAADAQRKTG